MIEPAPDYETALAAARSGSPDIDDDTATMALLCDGPLQAEVGAVSPKLVFEAALRAGLTAGELSQLMLVDPVGVENLQWT